MGQFSLVFYWLQICFFIVGNGMQADVLTKVVLPSSLFLIMLGIGMTLRLSNFKNIFNYPKAIIVGLIGQLILLPLIAFILALIFSCPLS